MQGKNGVSEVCCDTALTHGRWHQPENTGTPAEIFGSPLTTTDLVGSREDQSDRADVEKNFQQVLRKDQKLRATY